MTALPPNKQSVSFPVKSSALTLAVATVALVFALVMYLVPTLTAESVQWQTTPYSLRLDSFQPFRWPGYLWPISVLCLYAVALLPSLLPRQMQPPHLIALSRAATFLVVLLALLLAQWLVTTPMFDR